MATTLQPDYSFWDDTFTTDPSFTFPNVPILEEPVLFPLLSDASSSTTTSDDESCIPNDSPSSPITSTPPPLYLPPSIPTTPIPMTPVPTDSQPPRKKRKRQDDDNIDPSIAYVHLSRAHLLKISSKELEERTKRLSLLRPLTDAEKKEVKRQRRLVKNREYARSSRAKKKQTWKEMEKDYALLQQQHKQLEMEATQLRARNKVLEEENRRLRGRNPSAMKEEVVSGGKVATVALFVLFFCFGLFVWEGYGLDWGRGPMAGRASTGRKIFGMDEVSPVIQSNTRSMPNVGKVAVEMRPPPRFCGNESVIESYSVGVLRNQTAAVMA